MSTILKSVLRGALLAAALFLVGNYAFQAASRAQAGDTETQMQSSVSHIAMTARDRVTVLPEDGEAYYISIFTTTNWKTNPQERELVNMMVADPKVSSYTSQMHYTHYVASDAMYRARLKTYVGDTLPSVVVQRADGAVIYKASGSHVPSNANAMASQLSSIKFKPCPKPDPKPNPQPQPQPQPQPATIPDTNGPSDGPPLGLLMIALGVGAVLGLSNEFRRRV